MQLITIPSAAVIATPLPAQTNVPESVKRLQVSYNVTAVTGTTPTLDIFIEGLDVNGNWYTLLHPTQITAATAGPVVASIGPGAQTPLLIPDTIRVRTVIGGTTPSFTYSISVVGQSESG